MLRHHASKGEKGRGDVSRVASFVVAVVVVVVVGSLEEVEAPVASGVGVG